MNYGLYLSAAGMLTAMHRQDVIANNLANVHTVGFKPDTAHTMERMPARLEQGSAVSPHLLLEQLGGGQFVSPSEVRIPQGELRQTGNEFDLAIRGDGFFVLNSGQGEGAHQLRFTRDGRLALNGSGELVSVANGMKVLDENDLPIQIAPGSAVRIDRTGVVHQNDQPVARLQVTSLPDTASLRKTGDNLYRFKDAAPTARIPTEAHLEQGYVESSAVDPILTLNAMINATKAAQSNARMMQYHDHLLGQAIGTFGRIA